MWGWIALCTIESLGKSPLPSLNSLSENALNLRIKGFVYPYGSVWWSRPSVKKSDGIPWPNRSDRGRRGKEGEGVGQRAGGHGTMTA